jgi:hypothetical protein
VTRAGRGAAEQSPQLGGLRGVDDRQLDDQRPPAAERRGVVVARGPAAERAFVEGEVLDQEERPGTERPDGVLDRPLDVVDDVADVLDLAAPARERQTNNPVVCLAWSAAASESSADGNDSNIEWGIERLR